MANKMTLHDLVSYDLIKSTVVYILFIKPRQLVCLEDKFYGNLV